MRCLGRWRAFAATFALVACHVCGAIRVSPNKQHFEPANDKDMVCMPTARGSVAPDPEDCCCRKGRVPHSAVAAPPLAFIIGSQKSGAPIGKGQNTRLRTRQAAARIEFIRIPWWLVRALP